MRAIRQPRAEFLIAATGVALALAWKWPSAHAQPDDTSIAAATENDLSTREAIAQMKAGGNAVDAAVTAAFVAGVTAPTSSGIGGGGFAMIWLAAEQRAALIDFRETAPAALEPEPFENRPLPDAERGRLIGVPGEVKGLFELHQRHGQRPWAEVVGRAVRIARGGFPVSRHLANVLKGADELPALDAGIAGLFFARGRPAPSGVRVKNAKLGATLARIAAEGPSAFYTGAVAHDLVTSAAKIKGALTLAELASYRAVDRAPLHVQWEGHDIYTMPPPSAGGLMLAQTLSLYSRKELQKLGFESGAYQHMLAEALRGSIADRLRYVSDPDVETVDVAALLSKERMRKRKLSIGLDRTHLIPRFGLEGQGTHHLVTADAAGNVVSLTTTVNRAFGAKVTGELSGVVLNDELDDFTQQKQVAMLGLQRSPNRPRPGARPVSSMTPTIVTKNGQVVLALGGSGGPTIPVNVTQLLLARLVFGKTPEQAVRAPRFYVPTRDSSILLEKDVPKALAEDLESRGEIVATMPFTGSAVQMIAIENGKKLAASDPRKHGKARVERR